MFLLFFWPMVDLLTSAWPLQLGNLQTLPPGGALGIGTLAAAPPKRKDARDRREANLAAREAGKVILDGVYNDVKNPDGFVAECRQGMEMGFDGKTLIHPAQIGIANAAFAPTEAEIELAERQIAAYEAAIAGGQAVAVVDGRIVENLHVATARETLAKRDAIAALSTE